MSSRGARRPDFRGEDHIDTHRASSWLRQNESERQRALDRLDVLHRRIDERLDAILEMARRCFGTESVSLNVIDHDLQVSLACSGVGEQETPRAISLCDHLIAEDGVSVVPDASKHPVFHDYPNVVGEPFVRFYAGYPIRSPEGYRIGMLCLFDPVPRGLDDLEQEALRSFALLAQDVLWRASSRTATGDWEDAATGAAADLGRLVDGDPATAGRVERGLTGVLDHMRTGIYLFDHDWRLFFVNQFGRTLFPDPAAVTIGDTLWAIDPAAVDSEFGAAIRAAADEGVVSSVRAYQPRLRGWYESTTYPIDEGVAIYFQDVTAEQSTRQQLDDSMLELHRKAALLDATQDAVVVVGLDGTITYWNSGAEAMYGWSAAEAEGTTDALRITSDVEAVVDAWHLTLSEGSWRGELAQRDRHGTSTIADCRWQLERDATGTPAFVLCVMTDVTERRREQESRYRAQRMESLGTLAGGIAHDLNNVFTPILMSAQILADEESSEHRGELVDTIEVSVRRGADMIRQVLAFARGQDTVSGSVDVVTVLDELVTFCQATLPKSIDVHLDAPSDLWSVFGDTTQVLQILMNLVTNARDAMPGGGSLHISAQNVIAEVGSSDPKRSVGLVIMKVEDTGEGMDQDTLSRVFEPFFSTKLQGHGTGLGLSTSASIARSHGGDLRAYSERGRGSVFILELPRTMDTGLPTPETVEPAVPRAVDGQTVLVVEDEALIRAIVEGTLQRYGFTTLLASNGQEAVERMENADRIGQRIDVVFTDVMMPVMGGAELIAWMGEHRPGTPIVVTSGLSANAADARGPGRADMSFLAKPFTGTDVVRAVHTAIG